MARVSPGTHSIATPTTALELRDAGTPSVAKIVEMPVSTTPVPPDISDPSTLHVSAANEESAEPSGKANGEDDTVSETQGKTNLVRKKTGLFEFSNKEAIKEKVRERMRKAPSYNVHDNYFKKGFFQMVAKNPKFENLTLSIIVVNAFWIWIDTDFNGAETLLDAEPIFKAADSMFFGYFSIELFVRFMAFEEKRKCLKDGWFVFDSILVTLYAFDPFTIALMAAASGGGGLNLPTAVLRLFRLARLSRLIRMLRSLPELMIMIKGMLSATASVGYTLILLIVATYVFAIALRNLVPVDSYIETKYFPSVIEAMHNLILFGTFLDALSDFILAIKEESPVCMIFTWLYIMISALTVMNMLIGVLCEVISAVAEEEKESMMADKINEKFDDIVKRLDSDQDGKLSWKEFEKILDYDDAVRALESVGVDPFTLIEIAEDNFFDEGEEVDVEFQDFMNMVMDVRGSNQSTVKDILGLGKRVNGRISTLGDRMDKFESQMSSIEKKLDQVITWQLRTEPRTATGVSKPCWPQWATARKGILQLTARMGFGFVDL